MLKYVPPPASAPPMPLGRAHQLASSLVREAAAARLAIDALDPAGALRRCASEVDAVVLLGIAPAGRHAAVLDALAHLPLVTAVTGRTESEIALATDRGAVRIVLAAPESAGAASVWHTSTREHLTALQRRASARGLVFDNGLLKNGSRTLKAAYEVELYAALDLAVIPAELREGIEAVDAAAAGRLPALVEAQHIRGDLHMHSTWSDGRDSIEEMVLAARDLGYAYVAMTDHSQRSWSARAVYAAEVPRQQAEIEYVRRSCQGIEVLHGIEVEIMPDGTLDFEDHLLAQFDLVLASLHDAAGQDATRLTERYLMALHHPLVNVITHPANRTPGVDPGYALDFDHLFSVARETGTALEVDGGPSHLDMDGALARRAMASGAAIVINSDSHRADALARQMRFGVGTARRGWVEPGRVLNTGSVADVRAFVARKRQRA